MLFTVAGLQVPVMPLSDVPGRIGAAELAQIVVARLNAGVARGLIVTLKVVSDPHSSASGVKV